MADHRRLPSISLIAIDPRLLPVQERREDRAIGPMGGCRGRRMDELALAVDPDGCLHPEVPLVPLGGLMHLGGTGLVGMLRRTRGVDDRGIHDGPRRHLDAEGTEMAVDGVEQRVAQPMGFQQVPNPTDRGLVRGRFRSQINADEGPHGPLSRTGPPRRPDRRG